MRGKEVNNIILAIFLLWSSLVFADVTIDKQCPDRIDIGPNKTFDWVEVNCTSHLGYHNVIVKDFCDNGPILKVIYDPLEQEWFIYKAHSKWAFFMDRGIQSAFLKLMDVKEYK
jgi:hypothetical protein